MKTTSFIKLFLGIALGFFLMWLYLKATLVGATKPEFVTICHAAGLDTTTHFVTLTLPYNAVFGQAGVGLK